MQDRFKFRAWDKENKKYIYGVENGLQFYSTAGNLRVMTLAEIAESDKYELEQCTGLRDEYAQLIYGGDIIQSLKTEENYKIMYAYDLYSAMFLGENEQEEITCFYKTKVVGNIHETPELLEGK